MCQRGSISESQNTGESITSEGMDALKAELDQLENGGRTDIAERIRVARELGDLKENAEYHIAKEDQAHLETRIKRLRSRLMNAVVVDADSGDTHAFAFGRTAEVTDESTGKSITWTLVGATESSIGDGRLSAESPVGRALRDTPVGSSVRVQTPRGERTFKVTKLVD